MALLKYFLSLNLNHCFYVSQLLKCNGNIVVKYVFSMLCFSKPSCQAEVQHSLSSESKTFCSSWNSIFWTRNFLNSYVCYLTRGFITWTRAFNLLTRAFNLPTRAFDHATRTFYLATRAFGLATRAFILATRAFSLLARGFELVTRGFELVTREFELVTREFELVTRGFELVTRNSCFTFPHHDGDIEHQQQFTKSFLTITSTKQLN